MRKRVRSAILLVAALALLAVLGVVVAFAENIDPGDAGDQYAWGENVGWFNAEPANCSDCGVQVGNTHLEGYMWGENIGWVNMSCQNNGTCGGPAGNWGVTNDNGGNLAGYAWGENVGWISFSCVNTASCTTAPYAVAINPTTGVFSGYAWGENIGWISFSDDAPEPYGVVTSWRGASGPVGGIAELPDLAPDAAQPSAASPEDSGWPPAAYAALIGGLAAALLALTAGAWCARRRVRTRR